MRTPDDNRWQHVEQAWRAPKNAETKADAADANLASSRARARRLVIAQLLVSAAMLWLAVEALREHPGALATMLGVLIVLHVGGFWLVAAWNRASIDRLLAMDTRTFLTGWLGAYRRQLVTIRALALVLVAEVVALGYWLIERLATGPGTLLAGEIAWLGLLAVVLASAAWIFVVRARALDDLARIVAARYDLEAR